MIETRMKKVMKITMSKYSLEALYKRKERLAANNVNNYWKILSKIS